jgi:hypothetical protein
LSEPEHYTECSTSRERERDRQGTNAFKGLKQYLEFISPMSLQGKQTTDIIDNSEHLMWLAVSIRKVLL